MTPHDLTALSNAGRYRPVWRTGLVWRLRARSTGYQRPLDIPMVH